MKTIDKYLSQALDSYPFSLESTIESLGYALSCDDKNATALLLYARVHSEQLMQYEEAKHYYERALAADILAVEVYPYYIRTLVLNQDYEEADKLIAFALTIKGIPKAEILYGRVFLLEHQQQFKKALKALAEVRLVAMNSWSDAFYDAAEKRLKTKQKFISGKRKRKAD